MGESCGMWSTPSVVRRSANDLAIASGKLDRSRGQRATDRSHSGFGLATFIEADDDKDDRRDVNGDLKYNNNIFATTTIVMSSNSTNNNTNKSGNSSKQNSVWDSSREQGNESEEELNDQASKETMSTELRAMPKSFLGKERTNGSR